MHGIFAILTLVAIAAIIKPFSILKTRGHGLIFLIFCLIMLGSLPKNPTSISTTPGSTIAVSNTKTTLGIPTKQDEVKPSSKWEYNEETDKMRNQTTKYAQNISTDILNFDFPYSGGSLMALNLRKSPKFGNDVYITISSGQFSCAYDGCTIYAKFDEGKIQSFSGNESSDGSSNVLFISNYKRFVSELQKAKKLMIEVRFYQEGSRQVTFDVAGLDWK